MGYSQRKTERESRDFVTNTDIPIRLTSLFKLYMFILLQMGVSLLNQMIIYLIDKDVNLASFSFFILILAMVVFSLVFIKRFQTQIRNDSNLPIAISIIMGYLGCLVFMDVTSIFLPYMSFASSLAVCFVYFSKFHEKISAPSLLLIMSIINTFVLLVVYYLLVNNLLFVLISWYASLHFSFCLYFYSQYLIHNSYLNFAQNNIFFNLTAFTCELFIFPYTFMIDIYYKNYDYKKSLNFGFISV